MTDEEVHKQFEKITSTQFPKPAEFEKFLATSGQTVSDLLLRVKLNMLSQKIQQKIVKKAEDQPSRKSRSTTTKTSRVRNPRKAHRRDHPHQDRTAANEAKKEIESGKSFSEVAKAVSIDPTSKAKGG